MSVEVINEQSGKLGKPFGFWVQDEFQQILPGTNGAKAFTNNVTTGNFIVVFVRVSALDRVVTITDNLGNTYTQIATQKQNVDGVQAYAFIASRIVGGACTVTVSIDGAAVGLRWTQSEYFTSTGRVTVDTTSSAEGNGNVPDTGNITTTRQTEFLIAGGFSGGSVTWTPDPNGYTLRETPPPPDGRQSSEDKMVLVIGTYNATFTNDIATNWTAILMGVYF